MTQNSLNDLVPGQTKRRWRRIVPNSGDLNLLTLSALARSLLHQIDFSSWTRSVVKEIGPPTASTPMLFEVGVIIFGE